MKRRDWFRFFLLFLLTGHAFKFAKIYATTRYQKTPWDGEGPYYPVQRQHDEDSDLVRIVGQTGKAKGNVLNLRGRVVDESGTPKEGAIVEIWQADPQGNYNHPRDSRSGKRDSNFQYWGKAMVQADGKYFFRTVLPGGYSGRPPHIHYKVWINEQTSLTSQIYFNNHPQEKNRGFRPAQSPLQVIDLEPMKNDEFGGFFQIVI